jgi:RHS repeat-associated protein
MAINKGEQIDVSTHYWYQALPSENPLSSLTEILAGVILNLATASSGIIPSGPETGMALINNVNGAPFGALSNFLDEAFEDVDLSLPQAYLVYMYFDKVTMTIEAKNSGIVQVGAANELGMLTRNEIIPSKDGFFYVYVTNRSQLPVNFDNLTVKRWKPMVRASYDYYPYGLTWVNPVDQNIAEGVHDCTYQDKEFQFNEFGNGVGMMLHDFHARMYDGTTGRWLVPDPAKQFSNPYLAMGNNPIINEDPDGRFINQVFDAMEYVSPIVLRPLTHTGTDQRGFGWEVSIGIPKMYGFSYRWEYGRVKAKKGFGDKSGTEVYKGGEVTYFGFVSFGGKRYQGDYADGEFTQTTGTVTIGVPFKSVRYENDIMPWTNNDKNGLTKAVGWTLDRANLGFTPSADQGDRYRSAGMEMNVAGFSWGFQLFTGDPGFLTERRQTKLLPNGKEIYVDNRNGANPDKYREGIKYFGIGPFRFGSNGEWNRHNIQNKFAHDSKVIDFRTGRTVPYFKFLTEVPTKRYFYFGTGGGLGTY